MPDQTGRLDWITKLLPVSLIATLALLALGLVITVSNLFVSMIQNPDWMNIMEHVIVILVLVVAVPWAIVLYGILRVMLSHQSALANTAAQIGRLETLMEDEAGSMRKLIELSTLSDEAKSLLYHERELEAMREMMHGMLVNEDYKAAEALITSLQRRPSYAQEAALMSEEVESTRRASLDGKIDLSILRVEEIMSRYDWARAMREAQRMGQAFPHNAKVLALPARIETAKANRKRDLLQAYGEDVRKNDVDGSIQQLRELDAYLTPQEAAALQDSARGVFRAKLHNLGVQFAIRVTEGQWREAITVGETIVRDFPNTRMAMEVRTKMDQLHQRAAASPVPATTRPATPPQ